MRRVITISVAWAVFAAAAGQSLGDTCTFTRTDGVWANSGNWDCNLIPDDNDDVIILNGQICRIEDGNEEALSIDVQSGATLKVIAPVDNSAFLRIWDDSTINGTLVLQNLHPLLVSSLAFGGTSPITISGSGTIDGIIPADTEGTTAIQYFPWCNSASCTVTMPGLTITGIILLIANIDHDGTFLVDSAEDVIFLGWYACCVFPISVTGTGTFDVQDGRIEVGEVSSFGDEEQTWKVSGGLLEIRDFCTGCDDMKGSFEISGGTLDVDADLCTKKTLTFSGGTIDVAASTSAHFSAASCP